MEEYQKWFEELKDLLESAYVKADTPWEQSGFSGPEERWVAVRKPIANCMNDSGTFRDIGCANGYLLECVMKWASEREVEIDPWGLDLSETLVGMAKKRLQDKKKQIFVGNGMYWNPPRKFDYVRTELCYVPEELRKEYIERLLGNFVNDGGRLLVAEYRSQKDDGRDPWVDDLLKDMGFEVDYCEWGYWQGKELTRIALI